MTVLLMRRFLHPIYRKLANKKDSTDDNISPEEAPQTGADKVDIPTFEEEEEDTFSVSSIDELFGSDSFGDSLPGKAGKKEESSDDEPVEEVQIESPIDDENTVSFF